METFFLSLFIFGLVFVTLNFLLGFGHAHLHIGSHGVGPHGLPGHVHASAAHGHTHGQELSPINLSTVTTFLTWFGGVGYILTTLGTLRTLLVLTLATLGGFVGAAIAFRVISRWLIAGQTLPMRVEDYRLEGTVGRVTLPMEGSRTGELIYTKHGTTRSEGARSTDGSPLPRGTEVVILRYERGIAYVEPLDKLLEERGITSPRLSSGEERSIDR